MSTPSQYLNFELNSSIDNFLFEKEVSELKAKLHRQDNNILALLDRKKLGIPISKEKIQALILESNRAINAVVISLKESASLSLEKQVEIKDFLKQVITAFKARVKYYGQAFAEIERQIHQQELATKVSVIKFQEVKKRWQNIWVTKVLPHESSLHQLFSSFDYFDNREVALEKYEAFVKECLGQIESDFQSITVLSLSESCLKNLRAVYYNFKQTFKNTLEFYQKQNEYQREINKLGEQKENVFSSEPYLGIFTAESDSPLVKMESTLIQKPLNFKNCQNTWLETHLNKVNSAQKAAFKSLLSFCEKEPQLSSHDVCETVNNYLRLAAVMECDIDAHLKDETQADFLPSSLETFLKFSHQKSQLLKGYFLSRQKLARALSQNNFHMEALDSVHNRLSLELQSAKRRKVELASTKFTLFAAKKDELIPSISSITAFNPV